MQDRASGLPRIVRLGIWVKAEDEIMLPVVKDPGGRLPHGGERWVTIVGRGVGW